MLKIKDDVDLKELEKFGFEKFPYILEISNLKHSVIMFYILNDNAQMSIGKYRELYCDFNKMNAEVFSKWDSKLFDLIQAGLVEKVGI